MSKRITNQSPEALQARLHQAESILLAMADIMACNDPRQPSLARAKQYLLQHMGNDPRIRDIMANTAPDEPEVRNAAPPRKAVEKVVPTETLSSPYCLCA